MDSAHGGGWGTVNGVNSWPLPTWMPPILKANSRGLIGAILEAIGEDERRWRGFVENLDAHVLSEAELGALGEVERANALAARRTVSEHAGAICFTRQPGGSTIRVTASHGGDFIGTLSLCANSGVSRLGGQRLQLSSDAVASYLARLTADERAVAASLVTHWELSLAELVQVASGITRPE